jgi:hypothetical protein
MGPTRTRRNRQAIETYLAAEATRFFVAASRHQMLVMGHPDLNDCYDRAIERWNQTDYLKRIPSDIGGVRKFLNKASQALDQPEDSTGDITT